MTLWRTTTFFEMGQQGWTETLYSLASTKSALVAAAAALRPLRLALMTNEIRMTATRLSDDLIFRDSQFLDSPGYPFAGTWTADSVSDPGRVALNLRVEGETFNAAELSRHRRAFLLRGLPQSQTDADRFQPTAAYKNRILQFRTALADPANLWAIKVRDFGPFSFAHVDSIDAAGLVTLGSGINVPAGSPKYFVMQRPRGILPLATRPFLIQQLLGVAPYTQIQLANWNRPAFSGTGKPTTGAVFVYVMDQINNVLVEGLTTRKTGRPFELLRGRRSPAK